jgi:ABC-type dipeptide/oligopeptide/nickel transport system ATPase component
MRYEPLLRLRVSAGYAGRPEALRNVELDIAPGEIVGLVGQSGSGKSTLSLAILRLLHLKGGTLEGRMEFGGRDLMRASESDMRSVRGREIGLVSQSPFSALNPALRIGTQLREAWEAHAPRGRRDETEAYLLDTLASVSLPAERAFLRLYPRELSVGLAQRVLIAMAILHRPALLIADEPTSALDAITQAEILALFRRLNEELGTAILYISHDLLSVACLCRRVAILRDGEIVESGDTEAIFQHPEHPYTRRLVEALPQAPAAVGVL